MTERGTWHRFHPLSPLLRGGVAVLAIASWVLSQQVDRVFGADAADPTQGHLLLGVGVAALVLVGIVLVGWAAWRVSTFRLGESSLELRTGLVSRQHRQVRYDRIQAVHLVRPLLARLVGLSEVRVESAGGGDSHVRLAFLADATARELRDDIVALAGHADEVGVSAEPEAAGGSPAVPDSAAAPVSPAAPGAPVAPGAPGITDTPAAPDSPAAARPAGRPVDVPVLRVPNERLVQSMLYSSTTVALLVAVPLVVASLLLGWVGVLSTVGPATLAVGSRHVGSVIRWFNFEITHSGDALRLWHGLTELRTSTIPLHRIQAVELSQSLPWRLPRWWRIEVNVAGVGGRDPRDSETTVLPVGTTEEAVAVLGLLLPGVDVDTVLEAMHGSGQSARFTCSPARVRRLDPVGFRRTGYAVTERALVTRRGALRRAAQVVPHARVQSLALAQGPLERAVGVASVRLVSTPGPVSPRVAHLDTGDATRLLTDQVARSARARGRVRGATP